VVDRLVVLAPNWLGDSVMALPAIADLRRERPGATIVVAARRAVAPLFSLVPDVNDTIVLDHRTSHRLSAWRQARADLRAGGFGAAFILPNSFQAAFLAARAGIPERWGYRTDWRGWLLTRAIDPPAGLHQAAYYQRLAAALGFASGPLTPSVDVPVELRAAGAHRLMAAGWDGRAPVVALAPGAAYGGAKRWPPKAFAEVAFSLAAQGVATTLVGTAADAPTGLEIEAALAGRSPIVNLIGRTDLRALAGVLANCRAIVSNDSGAMHLAAAIGVLVTALFGPTNELATGPLPRSARPEWDLRDAPVVIVTHPVSCRPCMLRECPIDHPCMREISVERVVSATLRSL
jgi:heptosyltransferase-2